MTEYFVSVSQRFADRDEAVVAASKMVTSSWGTANLIVSITKVDDDDEDTDE